MKPFKPTTLLSAALFSLVTVIPFLPFAKPNAARFAFEITVTSSTPGIVQLFYDIGNGMKESDSSRVLIEADKKPHRLSFAMPEGSYRALRFDPLDREGSLSFSGALIRGPDGGVVRSFAAADFVAQQQIARREVLNDQVEMTTTAGANDPIMNIRIGQPFALTASPGQNIRSVAFPFLPIFGLVLVVVGLSTRLIGPGRRLWAWLSAHPYKGVAVAAVLSVVCSSYPVIFLGKSIVSPNFSVVLLYQNFPTLPGYHEVQVESPSEADVGAIMWQHVPLSMVQRNAILKDRELPLWNRYNSAGTVLIGQGQSMFGDPLQLLVTLVNGASWAWDLKYLVAKWLLACGLGLIVLRVARHLPAAILVALAADFVGLFVYRVNHPAIFSFCYAPWILYCWVRLIVAEDRRRAAAWTLGLIAANAVEMNSGTVKEAYMLLFTMNMAGAIGLMVYAMPFLERIRRLALAAVGGLLFCLITAPIWITFKDSLHVAYTGYNDPRAYQVQPSLLLGLFDEIFYRPFCLREGVYNPSANMLFLVGLIACFINLRALAANRLALAFGLAAFLPFSLVFGLIPPQWIVQVPYLANVAHIDNSFSCGLIILIAILAGCGFVSVMRRPFQFGRGDLALGIFILLALAFPYVAFTQVVQRSTYSFLHWGETLPYSSFVWGSLAALLAAGIGFMIAGRQILRRGPSSARILALLACVLAMLWRHGWHAGIGFKDYVVTVPPRVDFQAESAAVSAVQALVETEPARVAGFEGNLFPGWNDVYRLEGICGPDALINPRYRELLQACAVDRVWDWRYIVHFEGLQQMKPVYDFLNIRYYLDYISDHDRMGSFLTPVKSADMDAYRSDTAWPRAFFTDRLAVYGQVDDLAHMIKNGDGQAFAAVQAGDAGIPTDLERNPTGRVVVPARNYRLTNNTTEFEIEATGPGVAVLSENWLIKDFQATLDGQPVSYFRVNHAFKGIRVPSAGIHQIRFTYRPHHFTVALLCCGVGLALFAGSGLWLRYRKPFQDSIEDSGLSTNGPDRDRPKLTHI